MKRFDSINVIPFIDIMLVLLAIVLTTASFIAQGLLEIELPESKAAIPVGKETKVQIAIAEDQRIYLDEQQVDIATLDKRLSEHSRETPIVLRVDTRVPFGRFVEVVDLLKAYRMERLSILTKESG